MLVLARVEGGAAEAGPLAGVHPWVARQPGQELAEARSIFRSHRFAGQAGQYSKLFKSSCMRRARSRLQGLGAAPAPTPGGGVRSDRSPSAWPGSPGPRPCRSPSFAVSPTGATACAPLRLSACRSPAPFGPHAGSIDASPPVAAAAPSAR
jgi:hypothetical protein